MILGSQGFGSFSQGLPLGHKGAWGHGGLGCLIFGGLRGWGLRELCWPGLLSLFSCREPSGFHESRLFPQAVEPEALPRAVVEAVCGEGRPGLPGERV